MGCQDGGCLDSRCQVNTCLYLLVLYRCDLKKILRKRTPAHFFSSSFAQHALRMQNIGAVRVGNSPLASPVQLACSWISNIASSSQSASDNHAGFFQHLQPCPRVHQSQLRDRSLFEQGAANLEQEPAQREKGDALLLCSPPSSIAAAPRADHFSTIIRLCLPSSSFICARASPRFTSRSFLRDP